MSESEEDDIKNLLLVWMENCKRAQIAHNMSAARFYRLNYLLGVPVVGLSAVVGTSVFATLQRQVDPFLQVLVGMTSVLAAVLASLQTFLKYNDRASKHHSAGSDYEAIKRQIQETLVINNQ